MKRPVLLRTLYGRLAAALLAVLSLMGLLYVGLILFTTRMYFQEVSQKLNHDLARHLVAEEPLIRGGEINQEALAQSFHWLMVINPAIEIYLLDPEGRILAYSAPPEKVKLARVALGPIERFLDQPAGRPILGEDPRHPGGQKVFSAAPVVSAQGSVDGYLYVVLGGELYDSAVHMVRGSYILRLGLGALAVSVLVTLVIGLLLFRVSTRRLRRLTSEMRDFAESDFRAELAEPAAEESSSPEEIHQLDVTFHRMARRIAEQVEGLREADRQRRELVANVSHDLRTPLASLQGYLETLLLKEDRLSTEERRRYLEIAGRHSERLGKLVSELFELAKLDSGRAPLRREPFPLGELVQDVAQKFQLAAEQREVRLACRLGGELPVVRADIGLIERVLENLLDNALRHTPAGGEVTLTHTVGAGRVRVEVHDTGCGIPNEEMPFIFERFYRGQDSARTGSGRTGLGLAIARRILDLHGGTIQVDSLPGDGATFRFELAVDHA